MTSEDHLRVSCWTLLGQVELFETLGEKNPLLARIKETTERSDRTNIGCLTGVSKGFTVIAFTFWLSLLA